MRSVYVIDNVSGGLRYNNRWRYAVQQMDTWEIGQCFFVEGWRTQSDKLTPQFSFLNGSTISKVIGDLITQDKVDHNTIFIFPDARDPNVLLLNEFRQKQKLNFKILGFWVDGTYTTKNIYGFKNISWINRWEKCLIECIDLNLMTTDYGFQKFNSYYNKVRKNVVKCNLPFGNTHEIISTIVNPNELSPKEDFIVMNTSRDSKYDSKYFEILRNELVNYTFFNFNEYNVPEREYYRLLSKAKVLFSSNLSDTNPYSIFESMVMGVIPVLPNIDLYKTIFEWIWMYDKSIITGPYINFLRNKEGITNAIKGYIDHYQDIDIASITNIIQRDHFNSDNLKSILCSM